MTLSRTDICKPPWDQLIKSSWENGSESEVLVVCLRMLLDLIFLQAYVIIYIFS